MKHIFVRPARPEEAKTFLDWSTSTPNNLFDKDVAGYPSTTTKCAFDKKGPIVFVPVQQPFMMESLAIRPGADPVDVAVGLKEITQDVISKAYEKGVGEIYFLCTDESTADYATRQQFVELPWRVFRIRLKDLECESQPKA